MRIVFWPVFAVTVAVYLVMVVWTLPSITGAAGGLAPFDLRPMGYSFEEARAFLAALPADANGFYRDVQQRLDLFYPPLLAATLFMAIFLLAPSRPAWLKWALAMTALPGMVFDWLENMAVREMLLDGPEALTPELAGEASLWTLLKSWFSAFSIAILLVLVAIWIARRFAARRGAA